MTDQQIRMPIEILLVSDEESRMAPLEDQLTEVAPFQFLIECVRDVAGAAAQLAKKSWDLVLLDLSSTAGGLDTLRDLHIACADTPVVVLAGVDDETLAAQAVNQGAQDYIVKGHVNNRYLANALKYAVTRQKLRNHLVNQSLVDELSGLYNRRGLVHLGQQQVTMADRTRRGLLMFYVDLDDMKRINDSYGHKTGDQAIIDTSGIFRKSFRKSDIIARIGGDEFAILAVETAQNGREAILKRLQEQIVLFNTNERRPYHLSMSVGVATYDPDSPCTIDLFLDMADKLMYEEKVRRKKVVPGTRNST